MSQRNETVKNKIASIYISTAKGTLMSSPFSYSEKISREVSEGIVNYGDKLMSNAMAESDDDDEMDELNQMGDDFQAMVPVTALELTIDQQPPPVAMVHNLYPMPDKGFHISKSTVSQFAKGLEEIRNFLKMRAFQGFTAAIILLGQWTVDGVVFGGNQTVPVEVIERQIQNMLEGRGKQLAPMAVDLIMVDGSELKVSTIKANQEDIERASIH